MSVEEVLKFLLEGRVLTFLAQENPVVGELSQNPNYQKLIRCDLCLGFWVYLGLALLQGRSIREAVPLSGLATTVVHIFLLGVKFRFQ